MRVGAVPSSTVTVALQVAVLPLWSVTVSVTVLAPRCVQSKAVCDAARVATEQLSELPLSMSAAVMVALPKASSWMVMSWQDAVGALPSSIVTVALQVAVLPL